MTNDKDKKGKIIIFPENRIKKKITQPQDSPFTKDLALVIDCIRGLIYRDFNMAHAAQLMANKMVAIKFTRGGKASAARIDYSSFMKKSPNKQVFNKEFKEELNDLQDGSDMFESDMDLNGDDDKK